MRLLKLTTISIAAFAVLATPVLARPHQPHRPHKVCKVERGHGHAKRICHIVR